MTISRFTLVAITLMTFHAHAEKSYLQLRSEQTVRDISEKKACPKAKDRVLADLESQCRAENGWLGRLYFSKCYVKILGPSLESGTVKGDGECELSEPDSSFH